MLPGFLKKAVFLDRDGTLIVDVGYPRDPEQVRLLPGVIPALAELQRQGWALVVVSNQSGLGRGLITPAEAQQVHVRFLNELQKSGIHLDGVYYCPHAPEAGCTCRKPAPGMLHQAAEELALDLAASVLVGDRSSDVEAGLKAGCAAILFSNQAGGEPVPGVKLVRDWGAVVHYINGL